MAIDSTVRFPHLRQSETRRRRLHQAQRRFVLLAACMVGVAAGLVAVLYQIAVNWAGGLGKYVANVFTGIGFGGWLLLALMGALLGATAGWITERFAPEAGGSGIPHVKAVLMNMRRIRAAVLIPVKVIGGLLSLGAGMSLGREGPTIQIGASMGQVVAKLGRAPRRSFPTLIASGAGAGLAAAFNAPLAGFLFVMEELKREMSPMTYGAALIASVSSVFVSRTLMGQTTAFALSNPQPIPLRALPFVMLLGVVCAFVGIGFNKLTLGLIQIREKLKAPRWIAGAIVGAFAAIFLKSMPELTGGGHGIAESILGGEMDYRAGLWLIFAMLVGKLVMTSASFSTGVPGGIFAPILVMGALTGYLLGSIATIWFPSFGISPHVFATIGMAAVLSASVRAPLTGVVLIVEMTQQYSLLYALLLGAFISYILADVLKDEPIYEALLERDLHKTGDANQLPDAATPLDLPVEPDSYMDGRRIRDLKLPPGALVVTIEREGGIIVPNGSTRIRYGDHVTVLLAGDQSEAATLALHDAARAPMPYQAE